MEQLEFALKELQFRIQLHKIFNIENQKATTQALSVRLQEKKWSILGVMRFNFIPCPSYLFIDVV